MFGGGCGGVIWNSIKSLCGAFATWLVCFVFGVCMFVSRDWPRGKNVISRKFSKTSETKI